MEVTDYGDQHYGARPFSARRGRGPPKTLVSDNGPQFGSMQFEDWSCLNGIVHLTSAPFHPPSNGEAERLVDIFKPAMWSCVGKEGKGRDKG